MGLDADPSSPASGGDLIRKWRAECWQLIFLPRRCASTYFGAHSCGPQTDSYVNVRIAGHSGPRYCSNPATVARMTNAATKAVPSNTVASPSPVICQMMRAVPNSAPM
jgi:hypothetical protein